MKHRGMKVLIGGSAIVAALLVPQLALATTARGAMEEAPRQSPKLESADVGTAGTHGGPAGPGDIIVCPEGTTPTPFEMPIYDDQGLFVVGYETVWFCVPDDLEPAG